MTDQATYIVIARTERLRSDAGIEIAKLRVLHSYKNQSGALWLYVLSNVTYCEADGPREADVALLFLTGAEGSGVIEKERRAGVLGYVDRLTKRLAQTDINFPALVICEANRGRLPLHADGDVVMASFFSFAVRLPNGLRRFAHAVDDGIRQVMPLSELERYITRRLGRKSARILPGQKEHLRGVLPTRLPQLPKVSPGEFGGF